MKRSFKLKAFVLTMVVMMGLTLVPSLYATSRYTNSSSVTEDTADFVVSYSIDKEIDSTTGRAEVNPGDIVTVTISLDKLPDNGRGVRAFSCKLAWDASKLEAVVASSDEDGNVYAFTPGTVGTALKFSSYSAEVQNTKSLAGYQQMNFNSAVEPREAVKETGVIATIQFKVKSDAEGGNIDMFLVSDAKTAEENGFAIAGVKKNDAGNLVADTNMSYYVVDNMSDKLCIKVPATDVAFDGITSVDLDKTTKTSMDVLPYVKKTPTTTTDVPTFEVADTTIATVDNNGVVTAVANGSTTLKVTLGEHTATIPVTVKTSPSSITTTESSYDLTAGQTQKIEIESVGPDDVSEGYTLTWASSNTKVATVDANGTVTAVGAGTTNITVTSGSATATVTVNVVVPATGVKVEGIDTVALDKTSKSSMSIAQYVVKEPADTTDTVTYTSDNTAVATVDANGTVTAVGNGTANITVTLGKYTATVPVTVKTSPTSIKGEQDKYVVDFGETKQLGVVVGPDDVTKDYTLTWSSDNEKVATVDKDGNVTGLTKGTANITVKCGDLSATIVVSVNVPLKSITLDKNEVTVWKGDTEKVTVTANPDGAEWETLKAESIEGGKNIETAEVSDGITITGAARGTAQIGISANKNTSGDDLYKVVNVTIKENKVTSAVIKNEAGAEVLRGETLEMEGSYTTEVDEETVHKATDDTTLVWESLNPEIATVDANGVVTGVKEGTATIKLTVGEQTTTYEVKVNEIHVEGIVVSEEDEETLKNLETLTVGDELRIPFTLTPEGTITDTVDEILDFIKLDYDENLVDVKVEYNKETGEGMITVTVKAAGDVAIDVVAGDPEDEDAVKYQLTFTAVEPVEENVDTGDMPVVMMVVMMSACAMGVVASKKVFVK